jgi:hypothetical protein
VNFDVGDLETVEFVGGAACGRVVRMGKVRQFYDWEMGGVLYVYETEREPRNGRWVTVHSAAVKR